MIDRNTYGGIECVWEDVTDAEYFIHHEDRYKEYERVDRLIKLGVLEKAEDLGLEYISITDHDNCRAYNEFKDFDIKDYYSGKLVQGIELKCLYNSRLIEILGYNYDKEILENWLNEFYKNRQRKDTQKRYFNILYDVCFNHDIGVDTCLYFKDEGSLTKILNDKNVNNLSYKKPV